MGEGTRPLSAVDPGAGVSIHPGWGDGVPVCSKEQEDEGEPEQSQDQAIKIPMIGVCRRCPGVGE